MTITGQNFEVYQGDNKEIIIPVKNADGSAANLSGYNAVFLVYDMTSKTQVILKTTAPGQGITIPNPSDGELHITLDHEDTASLTPKNYGLQAEVEDSGGNHSTITAGYVKVLRSITHAEFS